MVQIGRYSGPGRGLSEAGANLFSGAKTKGGSLLQGIGNAIASGSGEAIDIIRDIYNTGNFAIDQANKIPTPGDVVVDTAKYLASPSASALEEQKKQEELKLMRPFGPLQKYTPTPFDELRVEEDQGLIDSNIQKEINKLTNQKGKTKGATDSSDFELRKEEDEGLISPDTTKADGKADTGTGTGGLTPEEQLMKSGMDSYIAALGEDVEVGSIEDYKKEFEKATGIDASGKVDKSMALTALGLALMQNKAGKGFNVGNILSEVGKAGEKALPALEKAKAEARAGQLAAGKYALGQRQKDIGTNQAKSQDIANKIFELNKMGVGQSYDMQKMNQKFIYDLALQKQQLDDEIRIAQMTPEEYGDKYMSKATKIELLPELNIQVQLPDKNYKGSDKVSGALLTPIASIAKELNTRERSYTKLEDELKEVNAIAQDGGTTIPAKLQSLGISWAKSFGMAKGMDNPTKRAQYILKTIQAGNAALILGEAGKTISDRDRALVEDFVGTISLKEIDSGDPEFLAEKLQKVFELTVKASRDSLDRAYIELGQYGYNLGPVAEKVNAANQVLEQ